MIANHGNVYLIIFTYALGIVTCVVALLLINLYKIYKKNHYDENLNFEEVIKQMPAHIYWKNKEGKSLYSNTQNWQDFGLTSLAAYYGKTDYDLFPKHQADKIRQNDLKVMQTDKPSVTEEEATTTGDDIALYLSHKVPLRNKYNNIVGILGVSVDITNAKKTEIERLEFLENIIALMPGHVYWVDTHGIYLGCNNNQAKSAGLASRKDIIGKRNKDLPWNFTAGELPETLDQINLEVMHSGKSIMIEEPATLKDGTEAIFLSSKAPIYNRAGEIIGMVGISIDITERRKIEVELRETKHKLEGMSLVGASIAHELRTPLASLNVSVNMLKDTLPILLNSYQLAKAAELPIENIEPSELMLLDKKFNAMHKEIRASLTFIDMLLVNINPSIDKTKIEVFSINRCIDDALTRYPFSVKQHELILWQPDAHNDFMVKGELLLVTHVLFNLIKNALYFVMKAGKGNIQISIERGEHNNTLYFKDTGTGIAPESLPKVFDRFFSKTHHGAGIGLTFCKMVMENLGGQITCESVEGDYTLFILRFPQH
jgi:two-component system aerobic respiration control sensor histidine kinase ArcB